LLMLGQFRFAHKHERTEIFNALVLYSNEVRRVRHYRMQMPIDFNKDVYERGGIEAVCKRHRLDIEFWLDFCKAPTMVDKEAVVGRKMDEIRAAGIILHRASSLAAMGRGSSVSSIGRGNSSRSVGGRGGGISLARMDSMDSAASSQLDDRFATLDIAPLGKVSPGGSGGGGKVQTGASSNPPLPPVVKNDPALDSAFADVVGDDEEEGAAALVVPRLAAPAAPADSGGVPALQPDGAVDHGAPLPPVGAQISDQHHGAGHDHVDELMGMGPVEL
jgi:hypothetical protein